MLGTVTDALLAATAVGIVFLATVAAGRILDLLAHMRQWARRRRLDRALDAYTRTSNYWKGR